jgi:ubiquinone/menaquinone biosynthesis C-methylase UbiE
MQKQPPVSGDQFKQAQQQSWSHVAQGWKAWWFTFEGGAQKVSDRLVELAGVKPGSRVLDVATGTGEPAVTAARKVTLGGRVIAADISPQMLAIAKERAASLGLQDVIEFREGDAESLALANGSFDAVVSRWGFMFFPNLPQTLQRFHAALAPGGRLAAAVWPAPERAPILNISFSTVRRELGLPPQPPLDAPPFNLNDPARLQSLFSQAGFRDVRAETITATFTFRSAEEYTAFQRAITAPLHAMMAGQPAGRQEQIWQAVTEAARQYADSSGAVRLENEVICCAGTRAD